MDGGVGQVRRRRFAGRRGASAIALALVLVLAASGCEAEGTWVDTNPAPTRAGVLSAVSCPTTDWCIAFDGTDDWASSQAGGQVWDGTTWTPFTLPGLATWGVSVDCPNPSFCVAVGLRAIAPDGATRSIAAIRRGGAWETVDLSPLLGGGDVGSVTCPSAAFCLAVSYRALLRFDGTSWSALDGPAGRIVDADCPTEQRCTAVGGTTYGGFRAPATFTWDGSAWTEAIPPQVDGRNYELYAVDCGGPTSCAAVGFTVDPSGGNVHPMAITGSGSSWVGDRLGSAGDAGGALYQVACAPAGPCAAVGDQFGSDAPLVHVTVEPGEQPWRPAPAPTAGGDGPIDPKAAACTAGSCLVVGRAEAGGSVPVGWAERFVLDPG